MRASLPDDTVPSQHALPATTWVDSFPWLEAIGGRSWNAPIDPPGSAARDERLGALAHLAVRRLARWQLGQIFPTMPPDVEIELLDMSSRGRNALSRAGYRTTTELAATELQDLLDLRNVGLNTIDGILRTLADASTASTAPDGVLRTSDGDAENLDEALARQARDVWSISGPAPAGRTTDGAASMAQVVPAARTPDGATPPLNAGRVPGEAGTPVPARSPRWTARVVANLETVARWQAALGAAGTPLLDRVGTVALPPAVAEAARDLRSLTATDILGPEVSRQHVAELLDARFRQFDERSLRVLTARVFAEERTTLDVLGRELGVTRERVRQLESRARARATLLLQEPGPVHDVADAVREAVRGLLPLEELVRRVPGLASTVTVVDRPVWRVLDALDDSYEIADGWCAAPSVGYARDDTRTILEDAADQHGVVALDEVLGSFPSGDTTIPVARLASWVASCGISVRDGHALLQTSSLADRAAALLSVAGEPMSADDLVSAMSVTRTVRSLRNALSADLRFVRTDRDLWALAEWGLHEYQPIRRLIREHIRWHGGSAPLQDVVHHIASRYSVTESSIVTTANSAPFETKDGVVRIAATPRRARKRPEETARVFRADGAWLYRITVTRDHLRGSGSAAPMALATVLGLEPGDSRELASPDGPQAVRWKGAQPSFGTVRRLLVAQRLGVGDEVFLVLGDDGTFRIAPVARPRGSRGARPTDLSRARTLVSLPEESGNDLAVITRAIRAAEGTSVGALVTAYRARGDTDVARLLRKVRDAARRTSEARGPEQLDAEHADPERRTP